MSIHVADSLLYVGVCYILKIFVLYSNLEPFEHKILVNITAKASKFPILCENISLTNKKIYKRSYLIFKFGMSRHPTCQLTIENRRCPMQG